MTTYDEPLTIDGPTDDELKAIEHEPTIELDWAKA